MEPDEAAPDLVGRTSARLLAAGVDRRARVDALRLLAILDASTDLEGRVRRPLDDLAAEFELAPLGVLESLDHLEDAGAVQRDGGTVIILGDGSNLGGLHLADFLDDVRASFEGAPAPTPSRRPTWLVRGGTALVAAAAAFAVVTMAPGSTPTAVEQLAATSTTVAPETTTTSEAADLPVPTTTAEDVADTATSVAPLVPPVDTSVVAAAVCPTGSPVAAIVEDIVRITNPTDEDIDVMALTVGGVTLTTPFTVPAGGFVERPVMALLTADGPSVDAWEWADTSVARSCPS